MQKLEGFAATVQHFRILSLDGSQHGEHCTTECAVFNLRTGCRAATCLLSMLVQSLWLLGVFVRLKYLMKSSNSGNL